MSEQNNKMAPTNKASELFSSLNQALAGTITIRRPQAGPSLKKGLHLRLKRYMAEVRYTGLNSRVIAAMFFSIDLGPKALRLMVQQPLLENAIVAITFEDSHHVYALARVKWCRVYNLQKRILGPTHFDYRAELEFLTGTSKETHALNQFWTEINRKTPPVGKS